MRGHHGSHGNVGIVAEVGHVMSAHLLACTAADLRAGDILFLEDVKATVIVEWVGRDADVVIVRWCAGIETLHATDDVAVEVFS
jgi:hypothetical protein